MKHIFLLFLWFAGTLAFGQNKIVPIKKNGEYVAPLFNPVTGAVTDVIVDSVNFWKPKPVIPIPTDDTTKIDGRNGTFVGAWTHATSTTAGWSSNTLSFSSTGGNTVTYRFQGTKIEFWGEKKPGHGTGVITVKLGTNVIDTKTVSFVNAAQVLPALIYTSPNLTPNTNYTIELKVTSGWNLVDFLVIKNYSESTGGVDPEPPTPSPGEILIQPGQDINNAIKDLPRGSNVRLGSGNHTIGKLLIPDGVNVRGSGKNNTFLWPVSGIWPSNNEDAMITLRGGTGTQVISDFTLKGNNIATGGVFVNRANVSVDNVRVENCKFFGLWSTANSGFKTYELDLVNNSWSSSSWCSGELVFGGILSNFDVELGLIQTTSNMKGYAIKILWNSVNNQLNNGKIHGGRIDLMHFSQWGNGISRNLSIEIHDCYVNGYLDIYDMIVENQISLALHRENTGSVNVYNSVLKLEGDTYAFEHVLNNLNVYNVQIYEAGMILANFRENMRCKNARIDNITFTSPSGSAMYGGLVYTGELGVENVRITNSKIDQLPGMPLIKHRRVPGGVDFTTATNEIY